MITTRFFAIAGPSEIGERVRARPGRKLIAHARILRYLPRVTLDELRTAARRHTRTRPVPSRSSPAGRGLGRLRCVHATYRAGVSDAIVAAWTKVMNLDPRHPPKAPPRRAATQPAGLFTSCTIFNVTPASWQAESTRSYKTGATARGEVLDATSRIKILQMGGCAEMGSERILPSAPLIGKSSIH